MEVKRYHRETVSIPISEVEQILRDHLRKVGHIVHADKGRIEPQLGYNPHSPIERVTSIDFVTGDGPQWP